MTDWKNHLVFSLVLFIIWFKFTMNDWDAWKVFVVFILSSFLSVFPDIDKPNTKVRRVIALCLSLCFAVFFMLRFNFTYVVFAIFLYFLIRFFPTRHRTVTHTMFFAFNLSILLCILLLFAGFNFIETSLAFCILFLSYISHLILDKQLKR